MKKKVINHAINIAQSNNKYNLAYQYTDGKRYFVTDSYRVLESDKVSQLELNAHDSIITRIKEVMNTDADRDLDYHIHHLPSKIEIKNGIKELVGRKNNKVIWSDGIITVNARYLLKAMESLNATVCYISKFRTNITPIFLYENDEQQSNIREVICQVRNYDMAKTGFWVNG